MSLAIANIGTAVPETVVSQDESLGIARVIIGATAEQQSWLPGMFAGSGIHTRHMAFPHQVLRDILEGTTVSASPFLPTGNQADRGPTTGQRMEHYARFAPPLAAESARRALAGSGVQPGDLTHLITVSCTGFLAPGLDRALITELALPPTIERTHVGFMGCHAALNGLRVARSFARSDPQAKVLLCAVELCGLHYHYQWDPQKIIANALFADGAAALVGVSGNRDWHVLASGSCLVPDSADAMSWTVGDHGFEMTLARRVPDLIARHLRPWLEGWLRTHGLTLTDVGSWAVHPGGPKILTAVEESLNLSPEAMDESRQVLAQYGNMSSPTVLFILQRLMQREAPLPAVALGFGPGLTVEAMLLG